MAKCYLTPQAAALRAFTVMPLTADDVECVLKFTAAAQTLDGCDYQGDRRIAYAETLIQSWIVMSQRTKRGEIPAASLGLNAAAYDAATLAYWLSNLEPRAGQSFCDGDDVASGKYRVVQLIDKLLLSALGMRETRPHLSTIEQPDRLARLVRNSTSISVEARPAWHGLGHVPGVEVTGKCTVHLTGLTFEVSYRGRLDDLVGAGCVDETMGQRILIRRCGKTRVDGAGDHFTFRKAPTVGKPDRVQVTRLFRVEDYASNAAFNADLRAAKAKAMGLVGVSVAYPRGLPTEDHSNGRLLALAVEPVRYVQRSYLRLAWNNPATGESLNQAP